MAAVTAQLILIQGDSQQFERLISLRDTLMSIGRAQNCSIIWGSLQISRQHATLEYVESKWYIRDTSTNGLSVNGNKLVKGDLFALGDADIISFIPTGTVRYRFRYLSSDSPERPVTDTGQQHFRMSPLPTTSSPAVPSSSTMGQLRLRQSLKLGVPSDSEDSNHSESLLSIGNPEDLYTFSGDDGEVQSPSFESGSDLDDACSKNFLKRKLKPEDNVSADRKKKRALSSSSSEEDNCTGSLTGKKSSTSCSSSYSKKFCLPGHGKLLTTEQIEKIDDNKELKSLLTSALEQVEYVQVKLKASEVEKTMQQEDFWRKEQEALSANAAFKEETFQKILEMMESELSCAVCNEIFIQATVVDCGHTFCNYCINEWAKKKQECPICRKAFRNRPRHIEVDNFISKVFESFSPETLEKRKASIKDREEQTRKAAELAARQPAERGAGNSHMLHSTDRYVNFLADIMNQMPHRANANGSRGNDRRRSARIQERVDEAGAPAAPGRGRPRGRGRNAGMNLNAPVVPVPPVHVQDAAGFQQPLLNSISIPVVTLNDSLEEGVGHIAGLRHPFIPLSNHLINQVRHFVPRVNLIDNSRGRDRAAPNH